MPNDEFSSQLVVDKLSDKALLRNACEFGILHRALVVQHLWDTMPDPHDANRLRSVALELTANYVASLEDAVLWFFVLKEWKPGGQGLFDLLDGIKVTESPTGKYSTQVALDSIRAWNIADLRREFGLPSDEYLLNNGWSEKGVNTHINSIREALDRLKEGMNLRVEDEGVLYTSYNKIKHGCLAIAATEYSDIRVSVMISSRRGPKGENGKRLINTGWVPCDRSELKKLAYSTLIIVEAVCTILNLLYTVTFDSAWRPPKWPVPTLAE